MDTRVAAYAVVIEDGRLLLTRLTEELHGALWTMPGGGIEPGEDPVDAAIREAREETGYAVEIDELLGIDSIVIDARDRLTPGPALHGLRIVYRAHVVGGLLTHEVGGTTQEAAWVPLRDIDTLPRVELVDAARRLAGLDVPE